MVVTHEQLVAEDRGEHLRPVIFESSMPGTLVQFEQRFVPLVERFHRLLPSCVEAPPASALQKLPPLMPQRPATSPAGIGGAGLGLGPLVIPRVLGAQEAPAGSPTLRVPLDALGQVVAVVAAVSRHRLDRGWQGVDLAAKVLISLVLAVSTEAKSGNTVVPVVAVTTTS
jgi:hypothetical protein